MGTALAGLGRRGIAAIVALAGLAGFWWVKRHVEEVVPWTRVDAYATCGLQAGSQTAAVQRALDAASGRTLFIPGGCRLLIGHPREGQFTRRAALTMPTGTHIVCDGHEAGFFLARSRCVGGAHPESACSTDDECGSGGRCVHDAADAAFAKGTADEALVLLTAAKYARDVRIVGCSIWVNGREPWGRCRGGTNDGRPCRHTCTRNRGVSCDSDADCARPFRPRGRYTCHGGQRDGQRCSTDDRDARTGCPGAPCPGCCFEMGACTGLSDCVAAQPMPGVCDAPPRSLAGDAKVNPIDFRSARRAVIDDVWIHEHTRGEFSVALGPNGRVEHADNTIRTEPPAPRGRRLAPSIVAGSVEGGIRLSWSGLVRDSRVTASQWGIEGAGGGSIDGNTIDATGPAGRGVVMLAGGSVTDNHVEAGYTGIDMGGIGGLVSGNTVRAFQRGVGIVVRGQQVRIAANQVSAWTCVKGEALGALNVTVDGNRCLGGAGPKLVAQGAGWSIQNNYLAWSSEDEVISLGSTGERANVVAHALISGNLLFSNVPGAALVRFANVGRRCLDGRRKLERCETDDRHETTGCPEAHCPGCCTPIDHKLALITGNVMLGGEVGVDLGTLGSGGSRAEQVMISNNQFPSGLSTHVRRAADPSATPMLVVDDGPTTQSRQE